LLAPQLAALAMAPEVLALVVALPAAELAALERLEVQPVWAADCLRLEALAVLWVAATKP